MENHQKKKTENKTSTKWNFFWLSRNVCSGNDKVIISSVQTISKSSVCITLKFLKYIFIIPL